MNTHSHSRHPAFTLMEVMVAVMIIAIVGFVMMKFVALNTGAIAGAVQIQIEESRVDGLLGWLRAQLLDLEPGSSTLVGEAHEFAGENSSDELSWTTTAGPSTLSQSGEGKFLMKLELERAKEGNPPKLRLTRQKMPDEGDLTRATPGLPLPINGSDSGEAGEIVLLDDAPGFEVRYFDSRVNSWVKNWSDTSILPALVKLKLWVANSTQTRELTVRMPPITAYRPRPNRQVRVGGDQGNGEEQLTEPNQPDQPGRPRVIRRPGNGGNAPIR